MSGKLQLGSLFVGVMMLSMLISSVAFASQNYVGKTVGAIRPPDYDRNCFWFTLEGVTQADPAVSSQPWFAVPRTAIGFKEIYALVITAKVAGLALNVSTTGNAAAGCSGFAEVGSLATTP